MVDCSSKSRKTHDQANSSNQAARSASTNSNEYTDYQPNYDERNLAIHNGLDNSHAFLSITQATTVITSSSLYPSQRMWLEYKKIFKADMKKSRICLLVLIVLLIPPSYFFGLMVKKMEVNQTPGSVLEN